MKTLLALLIAVAYVSHADAESCALELPLQQLNTVPSVWSNVYTELALPCSGSVKSWQFYAVRAGTFYASIWRPDHAGTHTYYTMVGKNELYAPGPGLQEIEITEDNIAAHAGDVIGIHYPEDAHGSEDAVVYVETATGPTQTIETPLSDVIATNTRDPCLPPGTITSSKDITPVKRVPALSVYIEESTSVTGDPHFMITSRHNGERLCFDADGKEGEVMKLILDHKADIYVNGRLFEIPESTAQKRQSYFSDIAIMNSVLTVIGGRKNITISTAQGYNSLTIGWGEEIDSRFGNARIVTGIIPNSIKVLFDTGVGLQLKMTVGKKIGPFLGVFVVHSDPLTDDTDGVLGKFIHADFDVYDVEENTAKIHFAHGVSEDIAVRSTKRWNGVLRGQTQCWLYKPEETDPGSTNALIGTPEDFMVPELTYRSPKPAPRKRRGYRGWFHDL